MNAETSVVEQHLVRRAGEPGEFCEAGCSESWLILRCGSSSSAHCRDGRQDHERTSQGALCSSWQSHNYGHLRLLYLVVDVCRGTTRRPRYKFLAFINSRLNAQYLRSYRLYIGSRIWAFDWYQNRWPWMTLNGKIVLILCYFSAGKLFRTFIVLSQKKEWRICQNCMVCRVYWYTHAFWYRMRCRAQDKKFIYINIDKLEKLSKVKYTSICIAHFYSKRLKCDNNLITR